MGVLVSKLVGGPGSSLPALNDLCRRPFVRDQHNLVHYYLLIRGMGKSDG